MGDVTMVIQYIHGWMFEQEIWVPKLVSKLIIKEKSVVTNNDNVKHN